MCERVGGTRDNGRVEKSTTVSVCGETPSQDCANGHHQGHTHGRGYNTPRIYIIMYNDTSVNLPTDNENRVHLARALPYRVVYTTQRRLI